MGIKNSYPAVVAYPPEMGVYELRTTGTLGIDDLTPAAGKRLRVLGFFATQFVTATATTTLRSTLAFGTGHTTDPSKILAAYRQEDPYDDAGACVCGINVLGDVDEVVRLTNVTFSAGNVVTRASVYYIEE